MKLSLKFVGLVLLGIAESATAVPIDSNGIIQNALRHGAHVVQCQNNKCQDQTTMEYLDHDKSVNDGTYLVYPNTPEASSDINRTRDAAKSLGQ